MRARQAGIEANRFAKGGFGVVWVVSREQVEGMIHEFNRFARIFRVARRLSRRRRSWRLRRKPGGKGQGGHDQKRHSRVKSRHLEDAASRYGAERIWPGSRMMISARP